MLTVCDGGSNRASGHDIVVFDGPAGCCPACDLVDQLAKLQEEVDRLTSALDEARMGYEAETYMETVDPPPEEGRTTGRCGSCGVEASEAMCNPCADAG